MRFVLVLSVNLPHKLFCYYHVNYCLENVNNIRYMLWTDESSFTNLEYTTERTITTGEILVLVLLSDLLDTRNITTFLAELELISRQY